MKKIKKDDRSGYWLDCDFNGGACSSYENGLRHIDLAKYYAQINNYGFAVSHLVYRMPVPFQANAL